MKTVITTLIFPPGVNSVAIKVDGKVVATHTIPSDYRNGTYRLNLQTPVYFEQTATLEIIPPTVGAEGAEAPEREY